MNKFLRYLKYKVKQHREMVMTVIYLVFSPVLSVIIFFIILKDWITALWGEYRAFEEK